MPLQKPPKRVTITLPSDLLGKSKIFCKKTGRTLSGLIKICLEDTIDKKGVKAKK